MSAPIFSHENAGAAAAPENRTLRGSARNAALGFLIGFVPSVLYGLFANHPWGRSLEFAFFMALLFAVLAGIWGRPMLKFLLNFCRI